MAILPQDYQLLLLIPKGIEVIIYLALLILSIRRLLAKPAEQRYLLNKLFIFSFLCWSIYMICDMIIYNIAMMDFTSFIISIPKETPILGYPPEYKLFTIAQILRDIAMVFAFLICYAFISANYVIRQGEAWVKQSIFKNWILNLICGVIIAILVAGDQIGASVNASVSPVEVLVENQWVGAVSLFIIVLILLITAILFFKTMTSLGKNDPALRRRSLMIGMGLILMAIGGIYWMVIGVINNSSPFSNDFHLILQFIGHGLWTLSPIFIYLGLREKKVES